MVIVRRDCQSLVDLREVSSMLSVVVVEVVVVVVGDSSNEKVLFVSVEVHEVFVDRLLMKSIITRRAREIAEEKTVEEEMLDDSR